MEDHSAASFLPLFLISVLAFLVPIVTAWLSQKTKVPIPVVVGEIICGMLVGKSFLGIINNTSTIPWLDFLYLFGFTYLMFLSGLEVDVNELLAKKSRKVKKDNGFSRTSSPLFLGMIHFILTLILAYGVSFVLKSLGYIQNIVMMTLILSTTSVGVVVPTLKEKVMGKTPLGQTILISALIADFLTMIFITIFVAIHSAQSTFNVLLLFVILAFIILLYKLHLSRTFDGIIKVILKIKPLFDSLSHSTSQIKVRGAIALMVIFISASHALGFEVILGAFLAGILTTMVLGEDKTEQLEMKLDAIGYGFFIPIFFIPYINIIS